MLPLEAPMNPQIVGARTAPPARQQLVVRTGESQTGSPIRFVGKETFVKLAAGTAACPVSVLEDVSPPHHGPPLHVHDFEEFFYILTGEFLFEVNGKLFQAHPGDFVHAPSGIPHIFQNTTDQNATMLVIVRPGGIENYFAELAERLMTDPGDVAGLNAIGTRYGITILGPPIAARSK
jgi:quercetin dioxygenase-like cupin family protein